jgi:hypothetical protein
VVNPELDAAEEIREIDRGITGNDDCVAFGERVISVEQRGGNLPEVHENEACVGWLPV